ncbi:FadR/GntR family transcriptional regulator [Streptomyces sp. NPDC005438]|uniref:FadR/GntR family transcriptional regulator n=1 Tax=Streptomyces sp. NPDC005438 TaxID=3156880 RepID=UPI0033B884D0
MLFTKALKVFGGRADKGGVTTLAHHSTTSNARSDASSASEERNRYSYGDPAGPRPGGALVWGGSDTDLGRAARRPSGNRGRGLHGQLVQQLGQMIVSGDLGADRPLVPEEIGQRFEVSRTVVRESLRVLEAKGLVSARPNVGTRVRPVSDWNLLDPDIIEWRAFGPQREDQRRELIELRLTIEPRAARHATRLAKEDVRQRLAEMVDIMGQALAHGDGLTFSRADAEFHGVLLQAAGNRMLEHLSGIVASALQVSGGGDCACEHPNDVTVALHGRIVEAMGEGDAAAAEEAARQLLQPQREPVPAQQGAPTDHAVPSPREH